MLPPGTQTNQAPLVLHQQRGRQQQRWKVGVIFRCREPCVYGQGTAGGTDQVGQSEGGGTGGKYSREYAEVSRVVQFYTVLSSMDACGVDGWGR